MQTIEYGFDFAAFDFAVIHEWLTGSYWSPGISRQKIEKGFRHSTLCIGAFAGGRQIGVARVVSDTTRFAYLADVFVDENFRGRGIAREMVRRLMEHPLLGEVDNWHLFTLDAHGVYAELGFTRADLSARHMVWRRFK